MPAALMDGALRMRCDAHCFAEVLFDEQVLITAKSGRGDVEAQPVSCKRSLLSAMRDVAYPFPAHPYFGRGSSRLRSQARVSVMLAAWKAK